MSKTTQLSCDCGCGKKRDKCEAQGWLILDQVSPAKHEDGLKLDDVLHFATIGCLAKWSALADKILPELQKFAREDGQPRGAISSKECKGFHI